MREIWFRGKSIKTGRMVYGQIWATSEENVLMMELVGPNQFEGIKVDPKTVGQYTGLTDRNGERIYEGDIVTFGINFAWTVIFKDFQWQIVHEKCLHRLESCDSYCIEVIGNIHETEVIV